jgi:hypothetical protein
MVNPRHNSARPFYTTRYQLLGKCKKQSGRHGVPPAITSQQSRQSSAQQWPDERRTQKYDRTRNGKDRENQAPAGKRPVERDVDIISAIVR